MSDLMDRMMDKFTVDDGCWEWTAAKTSEGYGAIGKGAREEGTLLAHRVMYESLVGLIPDGLVIDHLCRNRGCVNPTHMEPVTTRENVLRGEGLTAQQARRIRCPAGHFYTGTNSRGDRICLTCIYGQRKGHYV